MRGGLLLGLAFASSAGCAAIAGFDDFTAECPPGKPGCPKPGTGGAAPGSGGAKPTGGAPEAGGDAAGGTGSADAAPGGGASTGGATSCDGSTAPGEYGPTMSLVARGNGEFFWIDRTEVTVGQFAEYAAKKLPLRGALCEGDPGPDPGQCAGRSEPSDPMMPRTCVDWCEADGFCAWAGKELCHDDTDKGVDSTHGELLKASDFYAACATTAGTEYGCGEGCEPSACNGADAANHEVLPVATSPACCVPDACGNACVIVDLSGNVSEWTGACKPLTANGNCLLRGGYFDSAASGLRCATVTAMLQRRAKSPTVGFRCCAPAR